ncbi:MAG: PepSY domain-containing protein [Pontibacterium sp.]
MKKSLTIAATLLLVPTLASAGPRCTDGARDNWMPEETMKQQIRDLGYSIKKFKVTRRGCYEIYGWDQHKNRVEIYFHPETGEVVKKKMED